MPLHHQPCSHSALLIHTKMAFHKHTVREAVVHLRELVHLVMYDSEDVARRDCVPLGVLREAKGLLLRPLARFAQVILCTPFIELDEESCVIYSYISVCMYLYIYLSTYLSKSIYLSIYIYIHIYLYRSMGLCASRISPGSGKTTSTATRAPSTG